MLKMSTPTDLKSSCVPRNGMVKLPPQPNGLGSASITKGTPAAKNRLCQSSSVPTILLPPSLPYHMEPIPTAASLLGADLDAGSPTSDFPPRQKLCMPSLERQLVLDEKVLNRLLWYFTTAEKCVLAQVCKTWRKVLYQPKFWDGVTPILHTKELYAILPSGEKEFVSLQAFALRGFHAFCLVGVSDLDICEFIDNYPLSKKGVKSVSLKRSTITDAGLEVMLEQMQGLIHLELSGCNDFTEAGLWSSLNARLTSLSVSDCINVADDAIAAISQLLPNLSELSLQAYHVTRHGHGVLHRQAGLHYPHAPLALLLGDHQPRRGQHGAQPAQPDRPQPLGLLQDHRRWRGASGREPAQAAQSGPVLVPAYHRHGAGVHRLRPP
ncbi:hypothetical protein SKAU_G00127440 [Synaphobranchus kaupii]|uniref:F-box/LRR-repeat protein 16 n=1 Tax=Synaphobranchus kaupii TaxID=118154 RepID=A0A9Q1FPW7_SYNKA|nr:hypothetical protein SKAU_G00127440 [Synaphobranchus kaupii]